METCLAAPVLLALFLCGYSAVSPTNFGGYDEWWIRSLSDRLVLDVPYANRPLNFLWTLPGGLIDRAGFTGYHVLHGAYLWWAGLLLFVLLRRLRMDSLLLAFLAAAFVVTWAPGDRARLSTVQGTFGSGSMMGTILAMVLLVEARWRGSRSLLVAAAAVAWATIRGYEATLPLLLAAPLLVLALPSGARGWPRAWWLAWAAPVALATALTVAPAFLGGEASRYQMENARLDPKPAAVVSRLAHQYGSHLLPLVGSNPRELRSGRVALAAALLAGGCFLLHRFTRGGTAVSGDARRDLAAIAGGLVAAGLGYGPFVLSRIGASTDRTEYVSGLGIATALAAAAVLAARVAPQRWRWLVAALIGGWVVAVGTGRTLAMQRYWDVKSAFPPQAATLRELQNARAGREAGHARGARGPLRPLAGGLHLPPRRGVDVRAARDRLPLAPRPPRPTLLSDVVRAGRRAHGAVGVHPGSLGRSPDRPPLRRDRGPHPPARRVPDGAGARMAGRASAASPRRALRPRRADPRTGAALKSAIVSSRLGFCANQ